MNSKYFKEDTHWKIQNIFTMETRGELELKRAMSKVQPIILYEDSINFQKHAQRPNFLTIPKSLCLKQYCLHHKRTSHGLSHSICLSFVAEKSLSLTILVMLFCHIVTTWNGLRKKLECGMNLEGTLESTSPHSKPQILKMQVGHNPIDCSRVGGRGVMDNLAIVKRS